MDNSIEDIVASIDSKGFYATDNFSNEIIKDVYNISDDAFSNPSINGQKGYVKTRNVYFLQNTLSYNKNSRSYTNENLINC